MPEGRTLFEAEFARLRDALSRRFAASGDWRLFRSMRVLTALEADLGRPLRIAVMGEPNSGKSSLINVLMRDAVVPAGALASMRAYLLLRHGAEPALHAVCADGRRAGLTSRTLARMSGPLMRQVSSTRTNCNASESGHARREEPPGAGLLGRGPRASAEGITRLIEIIRPHGMLRQTELVEGRGWPKAASKSALRHTLPVDLAVWCTVGTQAWKETERQAWHQLPAKLRRGAILLVTYKDALGDAKQEGKLMSRLVRDAGASFAHIVLVSLKQAGEAIGPDGTIVDEARWRRSGAAGFEAALQSHINTAQRERGLHGLRLLHRLAAQAAHSSAPPALISPLAMETVKHFQGLIRGIEERQANGEAALAAELVARLGEGNPAVYGRGTG